MSPNGNVELVVRYKDLIRQIAGRYDLRPRLVAAVMHVESSGIPWAWNPEPPYRYLWNVALNEPFRSLTAEERENEVPPDDFPAPRGVARDAEWWGQQASWGLMQVMGAVARERGFDGRFMSQLCEPICGLTYGCRHLAAYVESYGEDAAIASYNGGPAGNTTPPFRNQSYLSKVREAEEAMPGSVFQI